MLVITLSKTEAIVALFAHQTVSIAEALDASHADGIAERPSGALYELTEGFWDAGVEDEVADGSWWARLSGNASTTHAGSFFTAVLKGTVVVCDACRLWDTGSLVADHGGRTLDV